MLPGYYTLFKARSLLREVVRHLPLDDLLAASGLDRCLRRHGAASLKTPLHHQRRPRSNRSRPMKPASSVWMSSTCPPSQASRWVYVALKSYRTVLNAKSFLKAVIKAGPFRVRKCLTDNGSGFTYRFLTSAKHPSGAHTFDQFCAEYAIEHRLIPPRRPQTNGLVECFKGRSEEVLQPHRFDAP